MDSGHSVHEQEMIPPWLALYRQYLIYALLLSGIGLLMNEAVFSGSIRGAALAVLDVTVAAYVLSSLKRIREKGITIFHLVVNAATLFPAANGQKQS